FDSDPSTPASPLPAPGRRVLATDFSGLADGVAWETDDAFATTQTSGGDSVIEVAGEAGVMQLASDQFSYVRADSLMEPVSDSELLVRFRIDDITADGRLRFWLRADE